MKIIRNLLTVVLFVLTMNAFAQLKEGKVSYDITYPNAQLEKDQLAMLPSETAILFKDDNARMDMKMALGMSINTITDSKGITVLMDIMGRKMAIKKEKEANGKSKSKVTLLDETKTIAGYKCKKALVDDGTSKYEIWYTDEILGNNNLSGSYDGISGFLMEFNMKNQQMDMHMIANSVSSEKIDKSLFEIPSDYKLMSEEEMKKMFGGK